jgi:hypothetical protein
MHIDAFVWMLLPLFVAAGSALLSYFVMHSRMEVALSKERESLAEARATIRSQQLTMEERVKATEEQVRRHALDEFMQDFRVEERSYVRESSSANAQRKLMVMQERLFFRNIPLSNWIEHEMVVEESQRQLPEARSSAFNSLGATEDRLPISKMIDSPLAPRREPAFPSRSAAYGTQ